MKALRHLTTTWKPSDVAVSDIEANNLLYRVSRFHCASILNPFTLTEKFYGPDDLATYLSEMDAHGVVVGHNFKGFDLLALEKLAGFNPSFFCFDTMVLSRLLNPERTFHSIESYGRQFKFHKGDYKDAFKAKMGDQYVDGMEWWEFNEEMKDYCIQDVRLNAVLFLYFVVKLGWWDWFGVDRALCLDNIRSIKMGDIKEVSSFA